MFIFWNQIIVNYDSAIYCMFTKNNSHIYFLKIWPKIKASLEEQNSLGEELEVRCQNHGNLTKIKNPEDFLLKCPEGGCNLICGYELKCGHKCTKSCHVLDQHHIHFKCKEVCRKLVIFFISFHKIKTLHVLLEYSVRIKLIYVRSFVSKNVVLVFIWFFDFYLVDILCQYVAI